MEDISFIRLKKIFSKKVDDLVKEYYNSLEEGETPNQLELDAIMRYFMKEYSIQNSSSLKFYKFTISKEYDENGNAKYVGDVEKNIIIEGE